MRALVLPSLLLVVAIAASCRVADPPNRPVDACVSKCNLRLSRSCSEGECIRGCEFILDRLVENESEPVLACVGRFPRGCGDAAWAECATRVGVHADGGPPAPPPPQEYE